jgi:hypothetical protein
MELQTVITAGALAFVLIGGTMMSNWNARRDESAEEPKHTEP